jgi:hypothetical protein
LLGAKEIWKACAPAEIKFFIWLEVQDRCWSSDRLHRHGLSNDDTCALYDQEAETMDHLLVGCSFSKEVWFKSLRPWRWQNLTPYQEHSLVEWWIRSRKQVPKGRRKAYDSLVLLVTRCIWLQRNSRVCRNHRSTRLQVVHQVLTNFELWCKAKLIDRSALVGE